VNARIALLHAPIAAPAEQFAFTRKQSCAHWNATLGEANSRLLDRH
jgi:hypothetical protein